MDTTFNFNVAKNDLDWLKPKIELVNWHFLIVISDYLHEF